MGSLDPARTFTYRSPENTALPLGVNGHSPGHRRVPAPGRVPGSVAKFSKWSLSREKRIFDVIVAGAMLCISFPFLLVGFVMVKISSPGPALFRQKRVGQKGIIFTMLKFRSMTVEDNGGRKGMTRAGDARVTAAGRILRQWKIDELPQLWNVIRGDMSLVGPRPYLAEYFGHLTPAQRQIFRVRPAVTGPATLCYRNEERCLAAIPEHELTNYYLTKLLPEKLEMDLRYMEGASFWSDVGILLGTARVLLFPRRANRHVASEAAWKETKAFVKTQNVA